MTPDPSTPAPLLSLLEGTGPIALPTALVAVHPDDECIAMAGVMARFTRLTLIHVTDGAPDHPEIWDSFGSRDAMAQQRAEELTASLQAAQAHPVERAAYGLVDGEVLDGLDGLVDRLARDLGAIEAVVTHPYEGGHIDHDACALAVHLACARLREAGRRPPDRFEFAGYHARRGRVRSGEFWPDGACREVVVRLDAAGLRRRDAAFACHASQEGNLQFFFLDRELFREAPAYDFREPPPPGGTLYGEAERERFRTAADRALGGAAG